ncbi:MAG: xanthine phosphoribosyltransferase [Armatimonadota bacterium]|nr:xanthine phosphoribosyltransferase [Armatimonadota bacterium]MDR7421554.1 xanthine phosphoribosyltransferase [Armatimonadota bacterium]MDR7454524.1 xanthine phosphoribosyltransferase [Armatimonadota bacterium]MDR7456745.1 xanthine phosphoribosyltransferase [Armatimonadota bacterium]MDR7497459.1 xanthine phosphoribosyltransferase [Armatimonadota bacterium]
MDALRRRILADGRDLGGGILKVDGFINHQVDPVLMEACGRELARRFAGAGVTKVLTAEISGIAPALCAALALGVPVVYARKQRPITMPAQVYLATAPSHTKAAQVELMVSPEYLRSGDRVLIVDDFLASGATILALARLVAAGGAAVAGVGVVIEKTFEGGRRAVEALGVPVVALARIASMHEGTITFVEEASR